MIVYTGACQAALLSLFWRSRALGVAEPIRDRVIVGFAVP
jgi:hypothetical protein